MDCNSGSREKNNGLGQNSRFDGNLSSRSLSLSSVREQVSGTPDILRSVKNLREKVSMLETVHSVTDEKIFRLMRVTDDYTKLLNGRRLGFEEISGDFNPMEVADETIPASNLMEDEDVRMAFDKLINRVSQLEGGGDYRTSRRGLVDHATSLPSFCNKDRSSSFGNKNGEKSHSSSTRETSDVERGRGAALAMTLFENFMKNDDASPKNQFSPSEPFKESKIDSLSNRLVSDRNKRNHSIGNDRRQNRDHSDEIDRSDHPNILIDSLENARLDRSVISGNSNGSLRRLSDVQFSKLKRFRENLESEIRLSQEQLNLSNRRHDDQKSPFLQNQEKFGCSPPKRLADLERDQQKSQCIRCGSIDCTCAKERNSMSRARKTVVPPLSLSVDKIKTQSGQHQQISSLGRIGRSPVKANYGTQTSFSVWKPPNSVITVAKAIQTNALQDHPAAFKYRSLSVPSSPVRNGSLSARSIGTKCRAPPFVACKSAGPSHSVLINLQQLLALLKLQNPFLYHACRNLDERDISLKSLADLFRRELGALLRKKKDELKEMLRSYDSLSAHCTTTSSDGHSVAKKRMKKLARTMELKDTEIQRLEKQLSMLVKFYEEAALTGQNHRSCHFLQTITAGILDSPTAQKNFAKPTASTMMKTNSARGRSKSVGISNFENVKALRDVKTVANAMSAC